MTPLKYDFIYWGLGAKPNQFFVFGLGKQAAQFIIINCQTFTKIIPRISTKFPGFSEFVIIQL